AFGDDFVHLEIPFVQNLNQSAWKILRQMIQTEINSPQTSSMGRLFDGVASLLSLRNMVNYEGQAAIELEAIIDRNCADKYVFKTDKSIIKTDNVIHKIVEDILAGISPQIISAKFHLGVAEMIASVAQNVRNKRQVNRVALSGGVFQNMFLLEQTCRILKSDGFDVFTHSRVPTNDGGISLGQAAIADALYKSGRI
nr:carbamoyltransferase HypF [Acidobacteriota bacterium]